MSRLDPIVLVHGLFGFDQIKPPGFDGMAYFKDIAETLSAAGYRVAEPPQLSPAGSVASRARELKDCLMGREDTRHGKPHLIAHSMGGLDARHMISELGMAERVSSLTTLGTPHEGSPIADWIMLAAQPLDPVLDNLARLFGLGPDKAGGIRDLTSAARSEYNARVPDSPMVRYYTVSGRYIPERLLGYPLGPLGLSCSLIQSQAGDNDGLVPVESARFQSRRTLWTDLGTWEANHLRMINWPVHLAGPQRAQDETPIPEKYLEIVRSVVGE
jgi:triacylglycerol lipase